LGEIILINDDGTDNFNGVSQICRSDPDKAIAKQEELGKVSYYIFDVAFWYGDCLLTKSPYMERYSLCVEYMDDIFSLSDREYILYPEILHMTHAEAIQTMKARKLEGLVVWDAQGKMKDKEAFTFNGKAYRPNVLWKSKPKYEDDFIVRFGEYGTGKNKNKIKNVTIYQLDAQGNEIYLGKCGGGLSDEQREFYTDESKFPRVWRIEYDSIQPKTGSLRFPVFNADRTSIGDKSIEECFMSDAILKARKQKE
jgi:ATP-dependent DNA ligase